MTRLCKLCGKPLPPPLRAFGRQRVFCVEGCGKVYQKERMHVAAVAKAAAKRAEIQVDRPAFAGSPADLASRAKEIAKDPALRAARARVRMIRDDKPKTVAQMLREIEDTRRKR